MFIIITFLIEPAVYFVCDVGRKGNEKLDAVRVEFLEQIYGDLTFVKSYNN